MVVRIHDAHDEGARTGLLGDAHHVFGDGVDLLPELDGGAGRPDPAQRVHHAGRAVAYDLYPRDDRVQASHDLGEFSLDVSKALSFVAPAPLADALGLKLKVPLRWNARRARVKTTKRIALEQLRALVAVARPPTRCCWLGARLAAVGVRPNCSL